MPTETEQADLAARWCVPTLLRRLLWQGPWAAASLAQAEARMPGLVPRYRAAYTYWSNPQAHGEGALGPEEIAQRTRDWAEGGAVMAVEPTADAQAEAAQQNMDALVDEAILAQDAGRPLPGGVNQHQMDQRRAHHAATAAARAVAAEQALPVAPEPDQAPEPPTGAPPEETEEAAEAEAEDGPRRTTGRWAVPEIARGQDDESAQEQHEREQRERQERQEHQERERQERQEQEREERERQEQGQDEGQDEESVEARREREKQARERRGETAADKLAEERERVAHQQRGDQTPAEQQRAADNPERQQAGTDSARHAGTSGAVGQPPDAPVQQQPHQVPAVAGAKDAPSAPATDPRKLNEGTRKAKQGESQADTNRRAQRPET
jgi:hypothetical protein